MTLEFRKASRKAVPILMSLSSVSGGGKTYGGLLIAAGLCRPGGRVVMADTENGRGEMYADSPGIIKALPDGYGYRKMIAPYTPASYIAVIDAAEKECYPGDVLLFDSASHEWEGSGGCCDIAEQFKLGNMLNWSKAKIEHKKFLNRALFSTLHIVFCLRAREKVKIAGGTVTQLGLQPIAEKAFPFEMMVSLRFEETTHLPTILKAPEALRAVFDSKRLVRKEDGEAIRKWNEIGATVTVEEQLHNRARMAAGTGMVSYQQFFESITAKDRATLKAAHEGNKRLAEDFDAEVERAKTTTVERQDEDERGGLPELLTKISDFESKIGSLIFGGVLNSFGKMEASDIKNELDAEDILAALKTKAPAAKANAA